MGKKQPADDKMYDPALLEEFYKKYISNLSYWLPDGVLSVDIELLQHFGLLEYEKTQNPSLTRFFHVMESSEKITLVNNDFIIWIVPENVEGHPKTYVLIAINKDKTPVLELAFVTSDVYNTSKLVLRVLEKLLHEIQENEDILKPYKKN